MLKDHEIHRIQDDLHRTLVAIDVLGSYHQRLMSDDPSVSPSFVNQMVEVEDRRFGKDGLADCAGSRIHSPPGFTSSSSGYALLALQFRETKQALRRIELLYSFSRESVRSTYGIFDNFSRASLYKEPLQGLY